MANQEKVAMIVAGLTRVPVNELKPDTDIFESRLITSLGLLDLMAQIEKEFGIVILPEELIHDYFASIDTIVRFVEMKRMVS
jgi:acyl carrier protein